MSLGMCILHGDYHEMDGDCWDALVEWGLDAFGNVANRDRYQAMVERRMLDAVLRELDEDGPRHGDQGVCLVCGGEIEYIEHQQRSGIGGEYEVLDAWWAHRAHPSDDHDALQSEVP